VWVRGAGVSTPLALSSANEVDFVSAPRAPTLPRSGIDSKSNLKSTMPYSALIDSSTPRLTWPSRLYSDPGTAAQWHSML
jgi:hypothetical protein